MSNDIMSSLFVSSSRLCKYSTMPVSCDQALIAALANADASEMTTAAIAITPQINHAVEIGRPTAFTG
jgi:hypothetical protein